MDAAAIPFRSSARRSARQRGAALVYGLFFLLVGVAGLFFLFNAGQLTHEKTRLVNTADAVAWSAGVLHARALNDTAYLNRALVAQEVLIAQAVSLQSWSRMVAGRAETIGRGVFPECRDPTGRGQVVASVWRFGVDYTLMCSALQLPGVAAGIHAAAEGLDAALPPGIAAIEAQKAALQAAQSALHAPLAFEAMRQQVLQQVADANYEGEGAVRVESGALFGLTDDAAGFSRAYAGDERARLAEVVRAAAGADDFVRQRQWNSSALLPHPVCMSRRNEVRRRGGTELVDFDAWHAADTESWWLARLRRLRCEQVEIVAIGGGHAVAAAGADRGSPAGDAGGAHGGEGRLPLPDEDSASLPPLGDAALNRRAFREALEASAASTRGTAYTGIARFHDLSLEALARADGDPRLNVSVRLVRDRAELRTSDGRSELRPGARVNAYESDLAGGVMAAVSSAQVYFARPPEHSTNSWGARQAGRSEELASLFNPFWQVRLVDLPLEVERQRLRQLGGSR